MIIKTYIDCEIPIPSYICEDVTLGYKNNPNKLSMRIISGTAGVKKFHGPNVKVMVDGRKADEFELALNPDFTINIDITMRSLKDKGSKNKNTQKDFNNFYKLAAGAIYYSKDELAAFRANETNTVDKYEIDVQKKFDEYSALDKSEQKEYQKKALEEK